MPFNHKLLRPKTAVAAGPPPFSPLDIANLALWLDASDSATLFDATSGGAAVATNGNVARWEDKSGNGRHATQGTANNRPTLNANLQNGRPGLTFDGTNDSLATDSFEHTIALTLFVVHRFTTAAQNGYSRIIEHGANNGIALVSLPIGDTISTGIQYGDTSFTYGPNAVTTPNLLEAYVTSAASRSIKLDMNGVNKITTSRSLTPSTPLALTISNYGGGGNYYGAQEMFEIVYYNRLLDDTERQTIRDYLNSKWQVF